MGIPTQTGTPWRLARFGRRSRKTGLLAPSRVSDSLSRRAEFHRGVVCPSLSRSLASRGDVHSHGVFMVRVRTSACIFGVMLLAATLVAQLGSELAIPVHLQDG